jgi:transcriptional regulator with XRE-family HTH domain
MPHERREDVRESIGARLEKARRLAGITNQQEASKALGLGVNTVGLWERNEQVPRADNLAALCKLYHVSSDWILGLTEIPNIRGSGGIIDLAVERAVLRARTWKEAEADARQLSAVLDDKGMPRNAPTIVFGYRIPEEFEVISDAEWEARRVAVESKLERLDRDQPGFFKRKPRKGE